MKFELKGYDVTYNKEDQSASIYLDGKEVLWTRFNYAPGGIFQIIGGIAICMVQFELLKEEDIAEVMRICRLPMELVRNETNDFRKTWCSLPVN